MYKISGVACDTLLKACGSPLVVYDENKIDEQIRLYVDNFKSSTFETEVIYASKAFTCVAMLEKLQKEGASIDVVSGGELYVAIQAKFPAQRIYFHGNNKLDEEIIMALDYQVKTIIIDNLHEVHRVIALAEQKQQPVDVLIRINPKVEAHTHEFIATATADSKFGISIDLVEEIKQMITLIEESSYVTFKGFHSHIGSQILAYEGFVAAIDKMVDFIKETGITVSTFNIGGGFGVRYTKDDTPVPTAHMCKTLIDSLETAFAKADIRVDKVCMEPGRSIVGEAGYSLYTVGFTKQTQHKQFAFIDGGMADNIRPALYDAKYECILANKEHEPIAGVYEIAGKCCESGDILIHDAPLPKVEAGDILLMFTTGAYGYSMASNYNRLNRPAVVFVKDGHARQVLARESFETQMLLDVQRDIEL